MCEQIFRSVFVFAVFAATLNFVSSGESLQIFKDEATPAATVEVAVEHKVEKKTESAAVVESQPAPVEERRHL